MVAQGVSISDSDLGFLQQVKTEKPGLAYRLSGLFHSISSPSERGVEDMFATELLGIIKPFLFN